MRHGHSGAEYDAWPLRSIAWGMATQKRNMMHGQRLDCSCRTKESPHLPRHLPLRCGTSRTRCVREWAWLGARQTMLGAWSCPSTLSWTEKVQRCSSVSQKVRCEKACVVRACLQRRQDPIAYCHAWYMRVQDAQ